MSESSKLGSYEFLVQPYLGCGYMHVGLGYDADAHGVDSGIRAPQHLIRVGARFPLSSGVRVCRLVALHASHKRLLLASTMHDP